MHIEKKQILRSLLDNAAAISDKNYQKRVWIEGKGPECDNFDDTVCDFFGDGNPIIDNYKDFELTERQRDILITFRDAFREFSDHHDWPPLFIDTPEWTHITEMAQEVLREFRHPA
jgi:hypothetical protein